MKLSKENLNPTHLLSQVMSNGRQVAGGLLGVVGVFLLLCAFFLLINGQLLWTLASVGAAIAAFWCGRRLNEELSIGVTIFIVVGGIMWTGFIAIGSMVGAFVIMCIFEGGWQNASRAMGQGSHWAFWIIVVPLTLWAPVYWVASWFCDGVKNPVFDHE